MNFAQLLSELLKENHLSQSELSLGTGIPATTISGWLNAGRLPDYNSLRILCQFFQVSADELLLLNDNSQQNNHVIIDNRRQKSISKPYSKIKKS